LCLNLCLKKKEFEDETKFQYASGEKKERIEYLLNRDNGRLWAGGWKNALKRFVDEYCNPDKDQPPMTIDELIRFDKVLMDSEIHCSSLLNISGIEFTECERLSKCVALEDGTCIYNGEGSRIGIGRQRKKRSGKEERTEERTEGSRIGRQGKKRSEKEEGKEERTEERTEDVTDNIISDFYYMIWNNKPVSTDYDEEFKKVQTKLEAYGITNFNEIHNIANMLWTMKTEYSDRIEMNKKNNITVGQNNNILKKIKIDTDRYIQLHYKNENKNYFLEINERLYRNSVR